VSLPRDQEPADGPVEEEHETERDTGEKEDEDYDPRRLREERLQSRMPPPRPNVSAGQALAAMAFLCMVCLVVGFILGRTL
jgi:hypothetical protein